MEYPSAICITGPNPFTRFIRDMVKGILPTVRKPDENPPPRNESNLAGYHNVFFKHGFPFRFWLLSQKKASLLVSRNAIGITVEIQRRCYGINKDVVTPPSANPLHYRPATRIQKASGLQ